MRFSTIALVAGLSSVVSAHFELISPKWRGDTLETKDESISQWTWPCAGVKQTAETDKARSAWPLTGGSVKADFGHDWALTYINLGIGEIVTAFNVSLLSDFNQTGAGTFCLPETGRAQLADLDIKNGTKGSIQVIQISTSGSSLYNCADIIFTDTAKLLDSSQCKNSTGVSGYFVDGQKSTDNNEDGNKGNGDKQDGGDNEGAAASVFSAGIATAAFVFAAGVVALV